MMSKAATNPKPSVQIEWYYLVVHKNTCEHALDYARVEKQIDEKSDFIIFLIWYFTHRTTSLSS